MTRAKEPLADLYAAPAEGQAPPAREIHVTRRRAVQLSEAELVAFEPLVPTGQRTPWPLVARPREAAVDLPEWTRRNRAVIDAKLHESGALLFRGFDSKTLDAFKTFSRALSDKLDGYDERTSPRKDLGDNVFTSTIYPKDQPLHFHNANSYSTFWPMKIWFGCIIKSPIGGRTPLSDCRRVPDFIDPQLLERFENKGVRYLRNFMPGIGLSWQETFGMDSKAEVEAYCAREEIEYEWVSPTHLRTVQVRPALANHPITKQRVWFNQASLFHVSMLKGGIAERFREDFPEEHLPSNSYFGDGTPFGKAELDAIQEAYDRASLRFDWEVGDIALLDNMLIAHAREPFDGDRLITVAFSGRHMHGPWKA